MPQEKEKNKESDKLQEKEAKKEERKEIRRIEKIKKAKDKRMKNYRKYGRGQQKHSTMGMRSCIQAAGAVLLFGLAIFFAFLLHGNAGFTGAMGILAGVCAGFGIRSGVKGFRERERNYITCKVGLGINGGLLLILVIIFIGGF